MAKKIKQKTSDGFFSASKTVLGSVREFKKPSLLAPLFVMIEVILECLIPYIMTLLLGTLEIMSGTAKDPDKFLINLVNFLNDINGGENILLIIVEFGCALIALAGLSLVCGALSGKFCATASSGLAKNLRKDLYYKIQGFSFQNIDKYSTASLVTRLTTDVTNVEMSYMMVIRTAVRSPFMLIFSITMAFFINSTMALIYVITAPILAVALLLIMIKAVPLFNRIFKKYDAMNESVEENVNGMRVVKSYVREDYETEKFNSKSENIKRDFTKAEKLVAYNMPIMNFCIYLGIVLIFVVGSYLIISTNGSALKIAELQSFMTYSFQILMSLMMLSTILVTIVISAASIKRIAEVLNTTPTMAMAKQPITKVKDGSIEFENVSFKYSSEAVKFALKDVNLTIKSGQTIGIIGATGSSKTTLVQLIPRLYDTTEGCVKVAGVDVKDYDVEVLRDAVAMVLQKNVLFSGTINENMRWGNKDATQEEIIEACRLAQADEFIQGFPDKYETYIEQGGVNVSGGQKQRLCIARALLKKPKILILDDSTSAVDTKTDALIRQAFKEYIPSTTKIIIAQRIASVSDADKIIIIDGGKIVAIGNHDELLSSNEIYQELYYSQNSEKSKKEVK